MNTTKLLRTWVNDGRITEMLVGDEVNIEDFTTKPLNPDHQYMIHRVDGQELRVILRSPQLHRALIVVDRNELTEDYAFFRKI